MKLELITVNMRFFIFQQNFKKGELPSYQFQCEVKVLVNSEKSVRRLNSHGPVKCQCQMLR